MTDFDNTNTGALFKNKEKETERHPDYRGTLNVGGTEYWVSSWLKISKAGEKYMSLSVKAKDAQPVAKPAEERASKPRDNGGGFKDMSDDVPFNAYGRGIKGYSL